MKKTPTVWQRDPDDRSRLLDGQVNPAAQWVLDGEGVATRKYDGTCVLIRRDGLAVHAFARREVKPGKPDPGGFVLVEVDDVTGKRVGWEPAANSGWARYIGEALRVGEEAGQVFVPGTYELIGPKVNGNPERFLVQHRLIEHATAERLEVPRDWAGMRDKVRLLHRDLGYEGLVFHHPDGRMAKIKARDYR